MNYEEIESKIGYCFKNKALLERAFTHSSKNGESNLNYQSLEFLGDSIIDFIIAKRLMEIYPLAHEGELTRMRANIVSKQPLAEVVEDMDLVKHLTVGRGENKDNIIEQTKIKSDILEAVVAAIYYDSLDMTTVEKFILAVLDEKIDFAGKPSGTSDYKSIINEYCAKENVKFAFKLKEQRGPSHNPMFVYEIFIDDKVMGEGSGHTKREAQQNASETAIKQLKL